MTASTLSVASFKSANFVGVVTDGLLRYTLRGLVPVTSYSLYYYLERTDGVSMTTSETNATRVEFVTLCCRAVSVQLSTRAAWTKQVVTEWLTVSLAALPVGSSLQALPSLRCRSSSGDAVSRFNVSLVPPWLSFSANTSTSQTVSISEGVSSASNCTLKVDVKGILASSYAVQIVGRSGNVLTNALSLAISGTALPAPILQSAVFGEDGYTMTVAFDKMTNQAGFDSAYFTCNKLLSFACASRSMCNWLDATRINVVVFAADDCASPGSELRVNSGSLIRAACPAGYGCNNQQTWPATSAIVNVTIVASSTESYPVVAISAPEVIGNCSSLSLDLSSSRGNAGRSWKSMALSVEASDGQQSVLQSYLTSHLTVDLPVQVPARYFRVGVSYTFTASLCNFLGFCSVAVSTTRVIAMGVPTLALQGSSLKTMTRGQALQVTSRLASSPCLSLAQMSATYSWSLTSDVSGLLVPVVSSNPKNPSIFALPSYSLSANTAYTLRLLVQLVDSSGSMATMYMNASTQIVVQRGSVQACVRGGSSQVLRELDRKVMDGSCSHDEDYPTDSGLVYAWSCMQSSPVVAVGCGAIINATAFALTSSSSKATLQAKALSGAMSNGTVVMKVQLRVSKADGSLSSTSSVSVRVLPLSAAAVELSFTSAVSGMGVINPSSRLGLLGSLSVPSGSSGNYSWTVSPQPEDESALGSLLTAQSLSLSGPAATKVYLALPGNLLSAGLTYTFALRMVGVSGGRQQQSAVSMIQVTVNDVPRLGSFRVSPQSGVAFQDDFTALASNWQSRSLPLRYQISYLSSADTTIVLRPLSELSYAILQLPPGNLTCVLTVVDVLEAVSTANQAVHSSIASMTSNMSLAQSSSYLEVAQSALASYESDKVTQAVAAVSYWLNTVNCSTVPSEYCAALNRQGCYRTAQTCGSCLSDEYVGVTGDANSYCYTLSEYASLSSSTTHSSTRRRLGKDGGVSRLRRLNALQLEAEDLLPCVNDCSGHGRCRRFLVANQTETSACFVDSVDCYSACSCEPAYSLSVDCSETNEQVAIRQQQRGELVDVLSSMLEQQIPSAQVLSGAVSGLVNAAQRPSELSAAAGNKIVQMLRTVIRTAGNNSVEVNALQEVTATLNQVLASAELSATRAQSVLCLQDVLATALDYTAVVSGDMFVGEDPVQQRTDTLRSLAGVVNAGENSNCTSRSRLVLDQSSLESVLNKTASAVDLSLCPADSDGTSSLSFSVMTMKLSAWTHATHVAEADASKLPADGFLTDALSLRFSSFPSTDAATRVTITMPLSSPLQEASRPGGEMHVLNCTADMVGPVFFTCDDGSRVNGTCRGIREDLRIRCPENHTRPGCFGLVPSSDGGGGRGVDYGCTVLSQNDHQVTCSCPLLSPAMLDSLSYEAGGRRLGTANATTPVPTGTVAVSYVGMLQVVSRSFETTVLSAQSLNEKTLGRSSAAIGTLAAIIAVIAVAIFFSYRSDEEVNSKVAGKSMTKKKASMMKSLTFGRKVRKHGNDISDGSVPAGPPKKKGSGLMPLRGSRQANRHRLPASQQQAAAAKLDPIFVLSEEALPSILGAKSFWSRMVSELKRHHRWFGVVFYFSPLLPRMLRVVSLATNMIIMLFMQSITYHLTKGDDGSCATYGSEAECLGPVSPYSPGASKCFWTPDSTSTASSGECAFVQPDNSIEVVLFVAIFSALLSTPLGVAVDWMIMHVLRAPLVDPARDSATDKKARDQPASDGPFRRSKLSLTSGSHQQRSVATMAVVNHEFQELSGALRVYHQRLPAGPTRQEFGGK